ncbi:hypothetical protein [Sphingomonas sp.]|jgi:hypothetical protein|uniref:hypothetical protein n=1 Tax=Sphingomonas sp. TaxID=28214 RepID=UPI002E159012|nr:hypothetical protein [Sphingomonas sp.]
MSLQRYRAALRVRDGYWFAPKLFGWGATPVTWQGWLTMLVFIPAIVAVLNWAPTQFIRLGVALPMLAVFVWFVWTKTDGGFRWRWGPDRD